MENETVVASELSNQPVQSQSPVVVEKKHDLAWVIVHIWVKGLIVSFPASIILMIISGIVVVSMGFDMTVLAQRAATDPEFAKQFTMINQLFGFILIPVSYFGLKWGCKTALQKTSIDEKDFGKIGYWVGIIPILFSILNRDLMLAALIFGIFLTPKLVKKWLTQFNQVA